MCSLYIERALDHLASAVFAQSNTDTKKHLLYVCVCVLPCRSIEELQEQNQKLLAVVRELSNDQELRETETTDSKCVTHKLSSFVPLNDFSSRCKIIVTFLWVLYAVMESIMWDKKQFLKRIIFRHFLNPDSQLHSKMSAGKVYLTIFLHYIIFRQLLLFMKLYAMLMHCSASLIMYFLR